MTLELLQYELELLAETRKSRPTWLDLDLALARAIQRVLKVPAR